MSTLGPRWPRARWRGRQAGQGWESPALLSLRGTWEGAWRRNGPEREAARPALKPSQAPRPLRWPGKPEAGRLRATAGGGAAGPALRAAAGPPQRQPSWCPCADAAAGRPPVPALCGANLPAWRCGQGPAWEAHSREGRPREGGRRNAVWEGVPQLLLDGTESHNDRGNRHREHLPSTHCRPGPEPIPHLDCLNSVHRPGREGLLPCVP